MLFRLLNSVSTDRVDFATYSSFHTVRGVSFLSTKFGKRPLGGGQKDFRSTTENVAGIASMAKALRS